MKPLFAIVLSVFVTIQLFLLAEAIDNGSIGKNTFRGQKGVYYVLSDKAMFVIDPATQSIMKTITEDHLGMELPAGANWGDVVVTDDNMLFANDRTPGADTIFVVDTIEHKVIDRLQAGPRPVHLYYVDYRREVWSHNDEDGTFSVIHIDAHNRIHRDRLVAHLNNPGHGKLLFHKDLGRFAWKTNVAEPGVHKFDLLRYEYIKDESLHFGDKWCNGTHSLAYSSNNGYAYFQCNRGDRGTAVFDIGKEQVVDYYPDLTGTCYTSPDHEFIVCFEPSRDEVHILEIDPSGNTIRDIVLNIDGGPSKVAFVKDPKIGYILWFGLRGPRKGNLEDVVTGVSYVIWNDVVVNNRRTATNIPGGRIDLMRSHAAKEVIIGGDYLAAGADFENKVEIYDAYNMRKVGEVTGIPETRRLVFAPAPGQTEDPTVPQPALSESLNKIESVLAELSKVLDSSSNNSFASIVEGKLNSLTATQRDTETDSENTSNGTLIALTVTTLVICSIIVLVLIYLVYLTYSSSPKPHGSKSFSNEMS